MAKLAAYRYADALFELAVEDDVIDQYTEVAHTILTLENDVDFVTFFNNPRVSKADKENVVKSALKEDLLPHFAGLIHVALEKKREGEFFDVLKFFIEKVKAHKNIAEAEVTSAIKLNEEQINALQARLSDTFRKNVQINAKVDESLIAGVKILIEGKLIDATVSTSLANLKRKLLEVNTLSEGVS